MVLRHKISFCKQDFVFKVHIFLKPYDPKASSQISLPFLSPCHLGLDNLPVCNAGPITFQLCFCPFHFSAVNVFILTHTLAFSSRTLLNKIVNMDPSCLFISHSTVFTRGRVTSTLPHALPALARTALWGAATGFPNSAKAHQQSVGHSEIRSVTVCAALSSNFYRAK